ncbi:MAG: hypothetical protein ABF297_17635 [Thiogranum sp.]
MKTSFHHLIVQKLIERAIEAINDAVSILISLNQSIIIEFEY